jgi:hypothetical protein
MACILNGCNVVFEHDQGNVYVCDVYKVCDAFIFKFNKNMYDAPTLAAMAGRPADCMVNLNIGGDLFAFDRTHDLHVLVADTICVTNKSSRLTNAENRYVERGTEWMMNNQGV